MAAESLKHQRAHPRFATPHGVWVSWRVSDRQFVSRVRVISLGGLFITTPDAPDVGAAVTLLLSVPEGEIRGGGIVRNTFPDEGMGLEFTEMSEEARVRLQTLIARLVRSTQATEVTGPSLSA
jgi:Tfp pilus assembly protein PilZ